MLMFFSRRGFVVVGGKGANGIALNDVWVCLSNSIQSETPQFHLQEYDFTYQFWAQVTTSSNPSPRWKATGGLDVRTPSFLGQNNSIIYAGGMDATSVHPLSDAWRLNISGTLSPNLPNAVFGDWYPLALQPLSGSFPDVASTVISEDVVAVSGLCEPSAPTDSCDQSYVINIPSLATKSVKRCPAPRKSAVLVPNMNTFSSSFNSQVFLVLGIIDELWNDGGALEKGEVVNFVQLLTA